LPSDIVDFSTLCSFKMTVKVVDFSPFFKMFVALVMVMLFYILLYVWVSLSVWTVVSAGYRRPCSDFADMLRRLINCCIYIIIYCCSSPMYMCLICTCIFMSKINNNNNNNNTQAMMGPRCCHGLKISPWPGT